MSNHISFISANFVARQLNYHMTEGWMQGDKATNQPAVTRESVSDEIKRITALSEYRFSSHHIPGEMVFQLHEHAVGIPVHSLEGQRAFILDLVRIE